MRHAWITYLYTKGFQKKKISKPYIILPIKSTTVLCKFLSKISFHRNFQWNGSYREGHCGRGEYFYAWWYIMLSTQLHCVCGYLLWGCKILWKRNEIDVSYGHSTSIRYASACDRNIGLVRVGWPLPFIAFIRWTTKYNIASTNMESVNVSVTNWTHPYLRNNCEI